MTARIRYLSKETLLDSPHTEGNASGLGILGKFAIFWLELRHFLPYSAHFLPLRRNQAVRAT